MISASKFMISERKSHMATFLIQTDFNNEVGDITILKAKDILEAGNLFKRKRIKDKFIEKEYDNDFEEVAEEWRIMYQTSTSCMYRVVTDLNDITIIISELSNIDYGVIGRYGITDDHNNLFDIIKDGKSAG